MLTPNIFNRIKVLDFIFVRSVLWHSQIAKKAFAARAHPGLRWGSLRRSSTP